MSFGVKLVWLQKIHKNQKVLINHRRTFYLWLNNIFNRVDEERRQKVGPDIIAGEWILRCGGGVKYIQHDKYIWQYNALPNCTLSRYHVEGIDATDTYITDAGLDHLVGLEHLKYLNLSNCRYVSNLSKLLAVKSTLQELNISNCFEVKDLSMLFQLQNLKLLSLSGLTSIKDHESTIIHLKEFLHECKIIENTDNSSEK